MIAARGRRLAGAAAPFMARFLYGSARPWGRDAVRHRRFQRNAMQ
jgi:hypothetical protein